LGSITSKNLEHLCGVSDRAITTAIHIRDRHIVDFLGGPQPTAVVLAGEGEAGILDEIGLETKISRHSHGGFH
jgi:hypothetical protein